MDPAITLHRIQYVLSLSLTSTNRKETEGGGKKKTAEGVGIEKIFLILNRIKKKGKPSLQGNIIFSPVHLERWGAMGGRK